MLLYTVYYVYSILYIITYLYNNITYYIIYCNILYTIEYSIVTYTIESILSVISRNMLTIEYRYHCKYYVVPFTNLLSLWRITHAIR